MASITFTLTNDDGTAVTKTAVMVAADVPRLFAFLSYNYPQAVDTNGAPVPKDVNWAMGAWVSDAVAKIVAGIHAYEQGVAAAAATAAVQPVAVTVN